MSTTEYILMASWAAMLCAIWASVLIVPRQLRSMFRHRLWALRDDVVDAVRAGDLPRNDLTDAFVRCIQGTIDHSKHWTLFRWLFWPSAPKGDREEFRRFVESSLRDMPEAQREQFGQFAKRFEVILVKQLLLGSVSGWAAIIALSVAAIVLSPFAALARSLQLLRNGYRCFVDSFVGDMATASTRLRIYGPCP